MKCLPNLALILRENRTWTKNAPGWGALSTTLTGYTLSNTHFSNVSCLIDAFAFSAVAPTAAAAAAVVACNLLCLCVASFCGLMSPVINVCSGGADGDCCGGSAAPCKSVSRDEGKPVRVPLRRGGRSSPRCVPTVATVMIHCWWCC